ncbi:MAG: HlyD family type I secretion periplasmic adaptor subunit [Alphaproteobacteria bacterium]|nr:HlyD family type I secretion periplasmic adaptor subunit [Alphaproteobacteria bacterium]
MKEFDREALSILDLADKYDEDMHPYTTLRTKDYALLYAILAFVVLFVAWAFFAKVDERALGQGRVIPTGEVQIVQNLEGGIIESFSVSEGDTVKAGDLLLRMSNVQAGSDYQAALQRFYSLKAALARLEAEAGDTAPDFPQELKASAPEAVVLEQSAWQSGQTQFKSQINILEQQRDQKHQQANEIRAKVKGIQQVLSYTQEEYDMIAPLVERGTVSKVDILQIKSKLSSQKAELKNLRAALAGAEAGMKEAEEKISERKNARAASAKKEIAEKSAELKELQETLAVYKDKAARTEIRAPVNGTVKDIKFRTVGGVVGPGDPIMEIVPRDDALIIEVMVSPTDIAFIHPDQKATIKLTAYDYQTYGMMDATVREISADSFVNENGDSFYRVKVQSDTPTLLHNGKELPIKPGMVATVDIITGEKTIMNYLLSRFRRTVDNAMHER